MSDVLNGVVLVKDGFSFARNLIIQLHTKLNLARATEIRRLKGTGKSVYNPRWRDTNKNAYEQTIVFGVDEIHINVHFHHQSIFTAIHEDLAVAMGIIKANGNTTPGPSTLVAYQGNDYKKPDMWARFFKLTDSEENFLEMRASVNWEIRGLNGGWFEKEFVNPTRTLRLNDASPQLIGAGHEPRIASVPSPQDRHVHVGGPVHPTATCDHGDQSDGIFDPSHRNLPGFESKLF